MNSPTRFFQALSRLALLVTTLFLIHAGAGCASSVPKPKATKEAEALKQAAAAAQGTNTVSDATNSNSSVSVVLREGDVLRIGFPGNPNLNSVTTIRRDGKIALDLVGEVPAAGLTPIQLKDELVKLYGDQLIDKEVNVFIESSSYPIFVTGAVLRPGKVMANRPLSVLEGIMEAGGFNYGTANLKAVRVMREVDGRMKHYQFNLRKVMNGAESEPFYLKPSDIVYVPERFVWF
ncbi:MAG TPA: polysaccharide biosynthesis/export family protein [Verrucomicrobiae bacterium]|nr:polysaccharide biosynthesis/export family protein [Verrucomicrobiae bacterium]